MKNLLKITLFIIICVLVFNSTSFADVIFVNENTPASPNEQNGHKWPLAYEYMQDALHVAQDGDEIWVAAGTYYPDDSYNNNSIVNGDVSAYFNIVTDLSIYGGFVGTESRISQRSININDNQTIFSGIVGSTDDNELISHLMVFGSINGYLDRVSIKNSSSGALYVNNSTLGINDCKFKNNLGLQCIIIFLSNVIMENSIIDSNTSMQVIYCKTSNLTMENVTLSNNSFGHGSLLVARGSAENTLIMSLCLIESNISTSGDAGTCLLLQQKSTITDCDFLMNSSGSSLANAILISEYDIPTNVLIDNSRFTRNGEESNSLSGTIGVFSNVYAVHSNATIKNCIFNNNISRGNSSLYDGSAIRIEMGSGEQNDQVSIINNTFYNNEMLSETYSGHEIYAELPYGGKEQISISNCILWDGDNDNNKIGTSDLSGLNVNYSNVEGGYIGSGNINIDPKFVNTSENNFHLKSGIGHWDPNSLGGWTADSEHSPCIDKGDNSPFNIEPIPNGGFINMGAYGNTIEASKSNITPKIIYVDSSHTGFENGRDWLTAYHDLNDALIVATYGDEIWVAAGTYLPSVAQAKMPQENDNYVDSNYYDIQQDYSDNSKLHNWTTFKINNRISLFGGFAGGENSLSQRDWVQNPTILSGNIGNLNSSLDNCSRVLCIYSSGNGTVIDGFVIVDSESTTGDGIVVVEADVNIANCTIKDNATGLNTVTCGYVEISNCLFKDNAAIAYNKGGAIVSGSSSVIIVGSIFYNNEAYNGGAIYCRYSNYDISQCIFGENYAQQMGWDPGNGGAIYLNSSNLSIDFTTFYNNISYGGTGNAIEYDEASEANISNSILWNSPNYIQQITGSGIATISYSDIIMPTGTVYPGTDNINEDPIFVNPNAFDFHLASTVGYWDNENEIWIPHANCSPCIDAGDNTPCYEPSPNGGIVNIGAFGNTGEASMSCKNKDLSKLIMNPLVINNPQSYFNCKIGPNPFSQNLSINISIPDDSFVKISVYSLSGQKVKTIAQNNYKAGYNTFNWDGKDDFENNLCKGIYIIKIETKDYFKSTKILHN